jgi:predicted HAD superfamily Cof-like phosphohydrolase
MNYIEKVKKFHNTFSAPVLEKPQLISKERADLRVSLIKEELNELEEAIEKNDLVEIADALCDLQYVLSGAVLEFGLSIDFDEMFKAVHASNMSKACDSIAEAQETIAYYNKVRKVDCYWQEINGKYIVFRTSDDKVLKSINYRPVNIQKFLNKS